MKSLRVFFTYETDWFSYESESAPYSHVGWAKKGNIDCFVEEYSNFTGTLLTRSSLETPNQEKLRGTSPAKQNILIKTSKWSKDFSKIFSFVIVHLKDISMIIFQDYWKVVILWTFGIFIFK